MDEPSDTSAAGPRKKACTECRQQKAKCDAYLHPNEPCSRCKKMNTQCFISAPFKRENKRQRLSELEQETSNLRQKLMTAPSSNSQSPTPVLSTAIGDYETERTPSSGTRASRSERPTFETNGSYEEGNHGQIDETQNVGMIPTTSQTLDGVEVSARDIDQIFKIFFREYSPYLPILDPKLSPNACYQQSPLLFWAIIGTACRNYSENPTLFDALSHDQSISKTALLSIVSSKSPLQRIQAFLLLVTWPFPDSPFETNRQDTTFTFAGLLLHLALRAGLHALPLTSDEFFRVRGHLPDIDINRRSELWTQCVLAYQRTCLCKGFLARPSFDISPECAQYLANHQVLSLALQLQLKVQDLCVQCSAAISENGVRNLTPDQDRALSIIVRTFEAQIKVLQNQAISDLDKLQCRFGKLHIQIFYLFKEDPQSFPENFNKIQKTARQVIGDIDKLVRQTQSPVSIPWYIVCYLMFASFSLLRILKISIPLMSGEDEEAKSSLFLAIKLAKQMSTSNNCLCSKVANYLTQLWNSHRVFKHRNGTDFFTLRARSRLSVSPAIDAILWWREEFDPIFKAHNQASKVSNEDRSQANKYTDSSTQPGLTGLANQQQFLDFGSGTGMFDFDWFLDADLSFPQDLFAFPAVDVDPNNLQNTGTFGS